MAQSKNSPTQLVLDRESQAWADECINALGRRSVLRAHPALSQLTAWLEEEGRLVDCLVDTGNSVYAVGLDNLIERASGEFDGVETERAILAAIRCTAKAAFKGDHDYWGDVHKARVVGSLRATSGKVAVLGFQFCHFDEPIDWDGLFQSKMAYKRWLAGQKLLVSVRDFEAKSPATLLRRWRAQL
jgi:hypothetical protein